MDTANDAATRPSKGARAKFELEIHSNAKTTCLSQGFIIGSTEVDDDHGAWIFSSLFEGFMNMGIE